MANPVIESNDNDKQSAAAEAYNIQPAAQHFRYQAAIIVSDNQASYCGESQTQDSQQDIFP